MYVVCLLFYAIGGCLFLCLSSSVPGVLGSTARRGTIILFCHQLALDTADAFIISYRSGSYAVTRCRL